VGRGSHIFLKEVAGAAMAGGLQFQPIDDGTGHVAPDQVEDAVRGQNIHWPRTRLVCVENTHNKGGGVVRSRTEMDAILDVARRHGLKAHLDGARLFNAAICPSWRHRARRTGPEI
jgi:threonine aldolase